LVVMRAQNVFELDGFLRCTARANRRLLSHVPDPLTLSIVDKRN
jgi:hypothetical protein